MILVAVGTQFPFDRLVRTVDSWAGDHRVPDVWAQTGKSRYVASHITTRAFIPPNEFQMLLEKADLIVAHCGMGSILSALSLGKPILVMPRSAEHGEHRNDHQKATARRLDGLAGLDIAWDETELREKLERFRQADANAAGPCIPPKAPAELTDRIRAFLLG